MAIPPALSRKIFVQGAAAASTLGFPAFIRARGEAAETLTIGQIWDLTGIFGDVAENGRRGATIALDWWNQRGGPMGRRVVTVVEDDQNNPGVAVEKARKLVNQDRAAALLGTVSSAAALSASSAASALGVLFMAGGHADSISGKSCRWNTFQIPQTTWQLTHATGFSFAKLLGKRWYLITPDYAFGHSLAAGYQDVVGKVGGQIIENDLTPLGTSDFSPYLTKVQAKRPDCLVLLVQGADWVNCIKQASAFGITEKIPICGPFAELESIWALPHNLRTGYWGTDWYYKGDLVLGAGNTLAERFAKEHRQRYTIPPTAESCFGFIAMDRLLWAIDQAKSTDAVKLAKALEGARFQSLWAGESYFRPVNHALVWPMWFGKLRPEGTPGDPYDVFEIIDRQPASSTMVPDAAASRVCHFAWPS
ncbi:MAG: ABC transporter substrate-binding protein [bacterium]|nr:ABC transporter substrate-binding protein [bacterium]